MRGTISVLVRYTARPKKLPGRPRKENKLFKGTRLQGSRLRGRFYKYLRNNTLPVNWLTQSKVWFSFLPPEVAGKVSLTNQWEKLPNQNGSKR
jgi:hypothetical protein